MHISIRSITGHVLPIECELQDTIRQLKEKIAASYDYPIETQDIIICGRLAEDERTLASYEVQKIACVHLVPRIKPTFTLETHDLYVSVQNLYN